MADDKIFCGQLKARTTQYGEAYDILLFPDDIEAIRTRRNALIDGGRADDPVRLTFLGKRSPSNAWTHYGVVDMWEPDGARQGPPPPKPAEQPATAALVDTDDDQKIPF